MPLIKFKCIPTGIQLRTVVRTMFCFVYVCLVGCFHPPDAYLRNGWSLHCKFCFPSSFHASLASRFWETTRLERLSLEKTERSLGVGHMKICTEALFKVFREGFLIVLSQTAEHLETWRLIVKPSAYLYSHLWVFVCLFVFCVIHLQNGLCDLWLKSPIPSALLGRLCQLSKKSKLGHWRLTIPFV